VLTIDRFALALHCSAEPGRAEALTRRLREVVAAALPRAAQRRLGGDASPRPQPGGVWPTPPAEAATAGLVFIDRLEFDAALASAWSDDRLAVALAEALAQALDRLPPGEGATHGPGGSVRRYPDRAAWLAEYLVARAQGQAQGRWWFDALDGLASLPLSVALRTLIQTEGDDGWRRWLALSPAAPSRCSRP